MVAKGDRRRCCDMMASYAAHPSRGVDFDGGVIDPGNATIARFGAGNLECRITDDMPVPKPVTAQTDRPTRIKAVLRAATGNFLEMYDFTVFGYYAAAIGRTFFPRSSEFASLMLSFATF